MTWLLAVLRNSLNEFNLCRLVNGLDRSGVFRLNCVLSIKIIEQRAKSNECGPLGTFVINGLCVLDTIEQTNTRFK